MKKWKDIDDKDVRIVWVCDNVDCMFSVKERTCKVHPEWHENNGTPVCDCGSDMVVLKTQVRR